jgi:hypothetical protein
VIPEVRIDEKREDNGPLYIVVLLGLAAILNERSEKILKLFDDGRVQVVAALALLSGVVYFIWYLCSAIYKWLNERRIWNEIIAKADDSVFCGVTNKSERVFIKTLQRAMHTQVVGTTNAGKTESVILSWAIQDISNGRGLIIIDGKSDRGILDKVYAYTVKAGRADDFKLFSLSHVEESAQYNPLIGGTCEEIAERVLGSLEIEHSFYRAIQFEVLVQMLRVFEALKITATFERLHEAVAIPSKLEKASKKLPKQLLEWFKSFLGTPERERIENTAGLTTALSQFAFGNHGDLFRTEAPNLSISEALEKNQIVYFQLPVLLSPFLGKAVGKLVLQDLQSAIANRHRSKTKDATFFSVFLDDFTEYLYPGFVSILNKSRSANVGVVFAHQALGDIEGLGKPIANAILTNSNLKIFMRGTDPESAEYFARVIGTNTTTKSTERTKRSFVGQKNTGDASMREVEEFKVHPNKFKSSLGVGEGYVIIPYGQGARTEFVKFQKLPDLRPMPIKTHSLVTAKSLTQLLGDSKVAKPEPKRFEAIKFQE